MRIVKFYDEVDDSLLKFAVIITKTNGKWVFCKHKKRNTSGRNYEVFLNFYISFSLYQKVILHSLPMS